MRRGRVAFGGGRLFRRVPGKGLCVALRVGSKDEKMLKVCKSAAAATSVGPCLALAGLAIAASQPNINKNVAPTTLVKRLGRCP